MNDQPQTIPAVTDDDRKLARKWAESVETNPNAWGDRDRATARVILNDIPAPAPPTLADMTEEERAACQWMQADVKGDDSRAVIVNPYWVGAIARVMWPDTHMGSVTWGRITPRPDLPRLEWPGTGQDGEEATKVDYVSVAGGRTAYGPWTVARLRKKPDTATTLPGGWRLADHVTHGRVIVTNSTPDSEGHVFFVAPDPDPTGYDWHLCFPDRLTYIDTEPEAADATD